MEDIDLALGLAWYVILVGSTVLHEAAHALAAWKLGDPTAYYGGQVSLNPIPHIRREPIGMVVVPIISFVMAGFMIGWASAPFNPEWALRYPRKSAWMALAGPTANLLLVVAAALLIRLGFVVGLFAVPGAAAEPGVLADSVWTFLNILFTLNLILFTFNLLPLPPLDGSGAVPLLLSTRAARKYLEFMWQPMYSLLGIVIAWKVFPEIFWPLYSFAVKFVYP